MAEIKITVDFFIIEAENEREAEKPLDAWLIPQEDEDLLITYEVR